VPYSQDSKVVVERLEDGTAPTAVNVDDQRGVLAWNYAYEAGESRNINNGYRVAWPAGEEIVLAE